MNCLWLTKVKKDPDSATEWVSCLAEAGRHMERDLYIPSGNIAWHMVKLTVYFDFKL